MMPIGALEADDARELIVAPVADFPQIYEPAAIEAILDLTACQPYLIQLVCALLVERLNLIHVSRANLTITPDDVAAVVPLALERGIGYFGDLWRGQVDNDVARQVLLALARVPAGQCTRDMLLAAAGSEERLRQALRLLLRRELIVKQGDGTYTIAVPLISTYIRQQDLG